jgi:hypothetical protein
MAINTRSAFTYGHTITDDNSFINFSENGIDELSATIEIGSYTLDQFKDAVAGALNEIGNNEYLVSIDRTTRKITITADATFNLLVTTGLQVSVSAFGLMGFTTDRDSLLTYEGDIASGSVYYPQAPLYNYSPFENNQSSVQEKVNESSSGEIEVVSYGIKNLMECNIKYVTNIVGQVQPKKGIKYIEDNATGLEDLLAFMDYITKKRPIEFIPDKENFLIFTPTLYAQKLANYYETGNIKFRKLT